MNQECAVGYASEADIDAWMDLVALVRDAFPGLSLGEYRGNLRKAIAERRALCAKDARGLLGVLVLSDQHNGIGFLAVHPEARGRGVASALVRKGSGPCTSASASKRPNLSPAMGIHVSNSCCGAVPGTSKGRAAGTLGPVRRTVGPSTAPSIARMPDGAVHLLGTLALFAGMTCFREPFMKYEWKKHEKALYLPKAVPAPVTVPEHAFFMIRGEGNPNGESFLEAIGVLYALSYAVKMLPKKGDAPEGYYEYAVFPLEGVWDTAEPMLPGEALNKDALRYTLMIRQPDFVTDELAERILAATSRKKPHPLYASASFGHWNDGLCVQMLHVGPYDDEPVSFSMMQAYCAEHGLRRASDSHREIYLSDARKTDPARLKTVLRFGVEPCA